MGYGVRVYPRPCGGTVKLFCRAFVRLGLSPPVRGNHPFLYLWALRFGSIPARAGEPTLIGLEIDNFKVYPRPCGGTIRIVNLLICLKGLSPPVRGNPFKWRSGSAPTRSIPARAGEPSPPPPHLDTTWVYPRPCGGTTLSDLVTGQTSGLSPPVRGNLPAGIGSIRLPRSIPARAGEPTATQIAPRRSRVYPRPCGGTCCILAAEIWNLGLSPPVRGNPAGRPFIGIRHGSIPARAGEPSTGSSPATAGRVYPRPCGGTSERRNAKAVSGGLSPPVRGNRPLCRRQARVHGSIPARAGEPHSAL